MKITIVKKTYVNARMYHVNSQHDGASIVEYEVGCGCHGTKREVHKFWRITENSINYDIPFDNAVEASNIISEEDASFVNRLATVGETSNISDFTGLVSRPNPDKIWADAQIVRM